MSRHLCRCVIGILVLVAPGLCTAGEVVLQPVDDTYLDAGEPNAPKGDWEVLDQFGYIGPYPHRPLLKFDLSSIPDGATILQAELTLDLITIYGGGTASLLEWLPNDDWAEETATWNSYDQSGDVYLGSLPSTNEVGPRTWHINVSAWNYAADLADNAVTFRTRWEAEANGYYKWNVYSSKEGNVPPTLKLTIQVPQIVGDLNCDGDVSFGDINPFVLYLSNFAGWQGTYDDCPPENGDINGDGTYPSFGDINPFVALLTGGR